MPFTKLPTAAPLTDPVLQELRLASVGLQKAPDLPLPNLVHLNLSSNGMTQIPFGSFGMMRSLRVLDLSNNAFAEVRHQTRLTCGTMTRCYSSENDSHVMPLKSVQVIYTFFNR